MDRSNYAHTVSFLDSHAKEEQLLELLKKYRGRSEDLIPMLQLSQIRLGYLPEWVLLEISRLTRQTTAKVFAVATFYAQFRLHPIGEHIIRVCRGTACHVRGSHRILKELQHRLGVAPGETTKDRLFTLETVACFGSCALAPVMVIGDTVYGRMNPSKAVALLEELRAQKQLMPTGIARMENLGGSQWTTAP